MTSLWRISADIWRHKWFLLNVEFYRINKKLYKPLALSEGFNFYGVKRNKEKKVCFNVLGLLGWKDTDIGSKLKTTVKWSWIMFEQLEWLDYLVILCPASTADWCWGLILMSVTGWIWIDEPCGGHDALHRPLRVHPFTLQANRSRCWCLCWCSWQWGQTRPWYWWI